MKIRYDGSSFLEVDKPSGVGHYSRLLYQALAKDNSVELSTGPFFRTTDPTKRPNKIQTILNKTYRKLTTFGLPISFDLLMPRVDLTVFPNFAHWPTSRSAVTAATIHDFTYLHYPELTEAKNLKHLRRVVPMAMKRADFLITVSESVKKEMVDGFTIPADNIVVTPVPVDPIYLGSSIVDISRKYNFPDGDYILFIGNLEPRKNLSTLVKAYQLLDDEIRSKYSLVLAGGKGWITEETEAVIHRAQQQGASIYQIGYIDQADAPSLYKKSSLLVLPSLYEGFGMQIMEAFATHTPVVVADIPVLREVAAGGAILVPPKSPEGFASAIKQALFDKDLVKRLDQIGQERLATISWESNAQIVSAKSTKLIKEG